MSTMMTSIAGATLLALSGVAIGGAVYWSSVFQPDQLDPETNCVLPTAPSHGGGKTVIMSGQRSPEVLAILIDGTGPISQTQAAQIRRIVDRAVEAMPSGSMISIGGVSENVGAAGARFARCIPPRGVEVSEFFANPTMAEARFINDFWDPFDREINAMLGLTSNGAARGSGDSAVRQAQATMIERGFSGTGAVWRDTGSEFLVTLPDSISFASGSDEVNVSLRATLSNLAGELVSYNGTTLHLIGHTDNVGPRALNQELSERRAEAVAAVMSAAGFDPERIRTSGKAFDEPIASNDTGAGRAMNRRVELVIVTASPIMESLQALVSQTPFFVAPLNDQRAVDEANGETALRRVIIVSDLLQHSAAFSFHLGHTWEDLATSRYFHRLGRNLAGVEIELLRIPRTEPMIPAPDAVDTLWRHYFARQGAGVVNTRTIGDL